MMELNAEPTTSRWLPSHVYANLDEATERMRYLIACYSSPGDPRLGPFVSPSNTSVARRVSSPCPPIGDRTSIVVRRGDSGHGVSTLRRKPYFSFGLTAHLDLKIAANPFFALLKSYR
jgi:hypothetical protein